MKNESVAGQISMTAHELMENAVKYSRSDEAKIRIEVIDEGAVEISVENTARKSHRAKAMMALVGALRAEGRIG